MAKKITSKDRRKIDNLLRSSRDYDDLFFGAKDIKSVNKRISKKKSSFFSIFIEGGCCFFVVGGSVFLKLFFYINFIIERILLL